MRTGRPFLTARWTDLAIITYAVPPGMLERWLPAGLELETRDGNAFVSLVAFDFSDTRFRGVSWPGYRAFPELNLRFYARQGERRGVVFIREYVARRMVTWIANLVYHENYRTAPLSRAITSENARRETELRLAVGGRLHSLAVVGSKPAFYPDTAADEHYFKELRWGFGSDRRGRTLCFEVDHPVWRIYPVTSYQVDLDWGLVYGPEWKIMNRKEPCSVILAEGSAVAVYPKRVVDSE